MSYMWDEFNIKTFPAETVVFRDGVFCPDLSTLKNTDFNKTYKKPIHIIYIGEISGKNRLDINISAKNQHVYLTMKIKNKKPAFLNIFIKNAGKNSDFRGHILLENKNNLSFDCMANHNESDTSILIKTKLLADKNSISKISGTAVIDKKAFNTSSDISFSAMADKTARIEFTPAQKISTIPKKANHSASIYQPNMIQIEYLRESGLSGTEVKETLKEAFINDFSLF